MNPIERIVKARVFGEANVGAKRIRVQSVEDAATEFGLSRESNVYFEVGAPEAVSVLEAVIHKDMAYGSEMVPKKKAHSLASEFVQQFPLNEAKFYTNGSWGKPRPAPHIGPSWSPATDATFDTGVLVLTSSLCACVWFKDED